MDIEVINKDLISAAFLEKKERDDKLQSIINDLRDFPISIDNKERLSLEAKELAVDIISLLIKENNEVKKNITEETKEETFDFEKLLDEELDFESLLDNELNDI